MIKPDFPEVPSQVKQYEIKYKIGSGASGLVYSAFDPKTRETFAAKFVPRSFLKDKLEMQHFESEVRIFERVEHRNIAKWKETIYLDDYIVIIMEMLLGGNMSHMISIPSRVPDNAILRIAKELFSALAYLHERGIAHRDIKPENIAFDSMMHPKIIDFGLCEQSTEDLTLACGTTFYVAPEVICSETYDGKKSDIWSLGVTLHKLATGRFPFPEMSPEKYLNILPHIEQFLHVDIEGSLGSLLKMMLVVDQNNRPTAKQLLASNVFDYAEVVFEQKGLPPLSKEKMSLLVRRASVITIKPKTLTVNPQVIRTLRPPVASRSFVTY